MPNGDVLRLAVIGQILRRRWRLLCALAALGAVVGAAASLLWPPAYQSSSRVLLRGEFDKSQVLGEAQVAKSLVVLDRAASAASPERARRLAAALLEIGCPDPAAALALDIAAWLAEQHPVVLIHPDPHDRSDGTLWDGLHAVLGERSAADTPGAQHRKRQGSPARPVPRTVRQRPSRSRTCYHPG